MTALERHLVLLKRSFFSLDRCSADTGPFFFRTSMRTADTCKSTARTEDNRLCSRCGLGRFTYRRKAMMMRCPVIRWQGERRKRQGLWRALAGGLLWVLWSDATPPAVAPAKSRCHATRQRLRTVARSVVGIAAGCLS